MSRISDAASQETTEVEQWRPNGRVDTVDGVEGIEHLDNRADRVALTEPERSLQTPVEREVLVALSQRVARETAGGAIRRLRLRGSGLHARAKLEAPGQVEVGIEVETVTNVSVGERVVKLQIVDIEGAVGERVALIGVIVLVFRERVVPLKLEAAAEALSHSDREPSVERFPVGAGNHRLAEERGEEAQPGVVQEPRQVNSFRVGEVEIDRKVFHQLMLKADVGRVDARVGIVATENTYP